MRKRLFASLILLISFIILVNFISPPPALAQPAQWILGKCYLNVGITSVATIQGIECLFQNIVKTIIPFVGLAVFIMIIVGSLQLLTSAGDAKQAQKASKTITYAVIGIIAILSVWFILKLIQTITGVDVMKFEIPK